MAEVTIISGFLGAGKTTLVRKLAAEAYRGERLALIENEFGQAGIDGGFLRDTGLTISELDSGCICCSLSGAFTDALEQVLRQYRPDRILIEPSGVGRLSDILAAVRALAAQGEALTLTGAVTVVDATRCEAYLTGYSAYYEDQVAHAALLVLSRTQALPESRLLAAVRLLRGINDRAAIVTTPWDALHGRQLRQALEGSVTLAGELEAELTGGVPAAEPGHDHDGTHDHDHGARGHHDGALPFESWSVQTPRTFTAAAVRAILNEMGSGKYGAVLRAKGILPSTGGAWLHFDYVPGEAGVRKGDADLTGRICVIGVGLNRRALAGLFGEGE